MKFPKPRRMSLRSVTTPRGAAFVLGPRFAARERPACHRHTSRLKLVAQRPLASGSLKEAVACCHLFEKYPGPRKPRFYQFESPCRFSKRSTGKTRLKVPDGDFDRQGRKMPARQLRVRFTGSDHSPAQCAVCALWVAEGETCVRGFRSTFGTCDFNSTVRSTTVNQNEAIPQSGLQSKRVIQSTTRPQCKMKYLPTM